LGLYDHQEDSLFTSGAPAAATAAIKATPGRLRGICVTNRNAAARYLLLFNSTASTATVYAGPFMLPPGDNTAIGADHLGKAGVAFTTGITFGISTSSSSYVAATGTEHDIFARYL
jgi:hypothetical protein